MKSRSSVASGRGLLGLIWRLRWRWVLPALIVAAAGGAYALVRPATWEASQALMVRNDLAGAQQSLGKFANPEDMRTVQETVLELLKSRKVVAAALAQVGPPLSGTKTGEWPDDDSVEGFRDAIKLVPPKGAEFGKTEVFYLKARDYDRNRATRLVSALCSELDASFQKLRTAKAASMVAETRQAADVAVADLAASTVRLSSMERQIGSDLAELRILHDTGSAESVLRRSIPEIRNELRQARASQKLGEQLLGVLRAGQVRPDSVVAMPNTLLESQPALRRLKEGLVDAQLRTSQLLGRMSAEHPAVKAAKESEDEIGRHVHKELANAARAVEVDLRLAGDRIALLEEQLAAANGRLEKVASLRAPYAALVAEVKQRTELCERAQQRLADARAAQATANSASLLSRIESPESPARPVGPGRAVIALVSVLAGLVTGLGIVLLIADPSQLAWSATANMPAATVHPAIVRGARPASPPVFAAKSKPAKEVQLAW